MPRVGWANVDNNGVRLERDGAVATIVVDQPERHNAIRLAGWQRLADIAVELRDDDRVRVVFVRGEGQRAFSAGADISEFAERRSTPELALRYNAVVHDALEGLAGLPQPLVALIHGYCLGGGCELALTADIRLAAESAVFGIPAARLGISIAYQDVRRVLSLVGPAVAKEILFTGSRFNADRALRMGLVNSVHQAESLQGEADQLVSAILDAAPTSVRWAKQAIATVLEDPALAGVGDASDQMARLFGTDDFREGVSAFMEKRKPRFSGR